MHIDILGVGDAYTIRNSNAAIRVIDERGLQCLIDCGPTVPKALWQRKLPANDIDLIYFTHIHPDHCMGLTSLLNQWDSSGRSKRLCIMAQRSDISWLKTLASHAWWPAANAGFEIVWLETPSQGSWSNWEIETCLSQHSVPNRSVRISVGNHSLFYSGDGRPCAQGVELMQRSTLIFQECGSYDALADNASHADFPQLANVSQARLTASMYLYHYQDADKAKIEQQLANYSNLRLAIEGDLISLDHVAQQRNASL
ncbi:ribonuclease Z [Alginatibacterium sediminis]|uniref:Ribonuclease Z n=1 Tax=Alginatibacterium sediminis TaxID=2164068 RepID=A0A420ED83_9ALTE|nr:MBL fold metallo-hydrolase [Alginatibacterium sediminis]RKF18667.1 ribonuclease Z [Alginatibacterium sediminis]